MNSRLTAERIDDEPGVLPERGDAGGAMVIEGLFRCVREERVTRLCGRGDLGPFIEGDEIDLEAFENRP